MADDGLSVVQICAKYQVEGKSSFLCWGLDGVYLVGHVSVLCQEDWTHQVPVVKGVWFGLLVWFVVWFWFVWFVS